MSIKQQILGFFGVVAIMCVYIVGMNLNYHDSVVIGQFVGGVAHFYFIWYLLPKKLIEFVKNKVNRKVIATK